MDSYLQDSKIEERVNTNSSNVPKKQRATRKRAAKKVREVLELKDEVIAVEPEFKQEIESLVVDLDRPSISPELKPVLPDNAIESPDDEVSRSKEKVTRKCINKELISNENGIKQYSYTYEIYDEEGKLKSVQKVNNSIAKKANNKYNDETDVKPVIDCLKEYFNANQIRIPSLYKRNNLDKLLKPLIIHINETCNIKFTQIQLRNVIRKHILEIE